MKKTAYIIALLPLVSCGSKKTVVSEETEITHTAAADSVAVRNAWQRELTDASENLDLRIVIEEYDTKEGAGELEGANELGSAGRAAGTLRKRTTIEAVSQTRVNTATESLSKDSVEKTTADSTRLSASRESDNYVCVNQSPAWGLYLLLACLIAVTAVIVREYIRGR